VEKLIDSVIPLKSKIAYDAIAVNELAAALEVGGYNGLPEPGQMMGIDAQLRANGN
jgi:hypothetical protein